MDKVQKQLIDSYFRKRKIAREQSRHSKYEDFEIIYMVRNNMPIDLLTLSSDEMCDILKQHPEYVEVLKPRLKFIRELEIAKILIMQPQLINYFDISRITGSYISMIIADQPELIDRFDLSKVMNADKISNDAEDVSLNIARIVSKQPQLVDKFDLTKVKGWHIYNILVEQPQLIDRFDLSKVKIGNKEVKRLLFHQPQLKPYFENLDSN